MKTPVCRIMVALMVATLFTLSQAEARTYNYTIFDVPGATRNTVPFGINNAGTIAGFYYQNGFYHGFIKTPGGSYTTIDVPGQTNTMIFGINANGRIVGGYGNPGTDYAAGHGFIYDNATYTFPFDVPDSFGSYPAGINLTGQIVGQFSLDGTIQGIRAFLWSGESFTTTPAPGPEPRGINDAGWIVGSYGDANSINHGFIKSPGGALSTFDVPGATHTFVSGINNHNWISGWYRHNDDICHGFVYDGRTFSYIDVVAGSIDVQVWGINDLGQVVGACSDHGFIAKPVGDISGLLPLLMGD